MAGFPEQATQTLADINRGYPVAVSQLLKLVYDELRVRARLIMQGERRDHTLSATALVHEAYLKLSDRDGSFTSRTHFFHAAAQAMRQIAIDHARGKGRIKRGAGRRTSLETLDIAAEDKDFDWMSLNEAMELLRQKDDRRYQVVMLRFFGGLGNQEIAQTLGVDESTVRRDWATARLWLAAQLQDEDGPTEPGRQ